MMIYEITLFFGLGAMLWLLSLNFALPGYGRQAIHSFDWISLALAFVTTALIGEIVNLTLFPALAKVSVIENVRAWNSQIPVVLRVVAYVILNDFLFYWLHRGLHSDLLWSHHAFHHSSKSLNPLAGMRGGPVHYAFLLIPPFILRFLIFAVTDLETFLAISFIDLFIQHFNHTSIAVPGQRILEKVIVTPRVHFIHHSASYAKSNSNFGSAFTVWDRMFGTYWDPESISLSDSHQLGLDYEQSQWSLFLGLPSSDSVVEPVVANQDEALELDSKDSR